MEEAALRYESNIDYHGFTCCTWMSNLLPRRAGVFVAICVLGGSAAWSRGGGRECQELIHADDPFVAMPVATEPPLGRSGENSSGSDQTLRSFS